MDLRAITVGTALWRVSMRAMHKTLCLISAITASAIHSTGWADTQPSFWDVVQFSFHIGAPYPVNLQLAQRAQVTKWEHNPILRIDGPSDLVEPLVPYFDRAIDILSQNYLFHPIRTDDAQKNDITAVVFDSNSHPATDVLREAILSNFEYDWGSIDLMSRIQDHVHRDSPCTTYVFDYETNLRQATPYVIILIDKGSRLFANDGFAQQCVFGEVGRSTTFFADVPLAFKVEEDLMAFETIYDASGTSVRNITRYTQSDIRMLEILNRPEIVNGAPVQPLISELANSIQ